MRKKKRTEKKTTNKNQATLIKKKSPVPSINRYIFLSCFI